MRRGAILVAVFGASVVLAAPAQAAPVCGGTANTVTVCVDPVGGILYEDCIYTGDPTCTHVVVPGPTIDCGGRLYNMLVPPLGTEPPC